MSRITLEKVAKRFGNVAVLHEIDLAIEDGELVVFVGPSGCGKSTLLRLIAGLDKPSSGQIAIDGKIVNDIAAADRGLAMVFQSYALYPHMSVRQNLAFGLENAHLPRAEIDKRLAEAARMLAIEPYLDRKPGQLSGGQRQRVAIGRAIVRSPTAFLLDEPLSNLDAELRGSMRAELSALHQRLGTTMIYVTHDQIEAMTLADRIVVLRAGRVEQVDTPLNLYNKPANRFVAGFIGAPAMNFSPAKVRASGNGVLTASCFGGEAELNGEASADSSITVGVRPHHLRRATGNGGIETKVELIESLGAETVVHCRTADDVQLIAVLSGQENLKPGDAIKLAFERDETHGFDSDGKRLAGN